MAYRRFKERLFDRSFDLGALMTQTELSGLLDVPVTPLRDAIRTLQSEGLVEILPRNGIRIVRPDMEIIRHTYQLRRLIEREAVARFAEVCTEADLAAFAGAHDALEAETLAGLTQPALGDAMERMERLFHDRMIASLANPYIDSVHRQTHDRIRLIRIDRRYVITPPLVRRTIAEHRAILETLDRRDAPAAMRAMDEHMTRALHRALGI